MIYALELPIDCDDDNLLYKLIYKKVDPETDTIAIPHMNHASHRATARMAKSLGIEVLIDSREYNFPSFIILEDGEIQNMYKYPDSGRG